MKKVIHLANRRCSYRYWTQTKDGWTNPISTKSFDRVTCKKCKEHIKALKG